MTGIELEILHFIQDHFRTASGDFLMPLITSLGNGGWIWLVLGILLLLNKKHRRAGLLLLLSLAIEVILCNVLLKPLVARPRPFMADPSVEVLIPLPSDYSFPSGHTSASFAATASLFFCREKSRYPALILSVLIAFSRLYTGVHYPSDIVAGVVIGTVGSVAAMFFLDSVQRRCKLNIKNKKTEGSREGREKKCR